jgi:nitronate monooxygenase
MALPTQLQNRLKLPLVIAPMFLASGPDLVIASCKAGTLGTFPALNQRTSEGFEQWLQQINAELDPDDAPYGVNIIVHHSNTRVMADLELCVKYKVPVVITSLGIDKRVIDAVHSYGGLVFHDIINIRHAKKAAREGVDGIIAVCAGAGGHGGTLNPLALTAEIRKFFDGCLLLSGCISNGGHVAAARAMGADLAYAGTRFIATKEATAQDAYKEMIVESAAADIMYTPNISGVYANFLRESIRNAGFDPDNLAPKTEIDMEEELGLTEPEGSKQKGAWKEIWSAGQGVGAIDDIPTTADLIQRMKEEFAAALENANKF